MSGIERRRSRRYAVVLEVLVRPPDGTVRQGQSRDVSQNGIFIQLGEGSLDTEQRVELEIRPPHSPEPILVTGLIVHRLAGVGNGVQFLDVTPRAVALIDALIEDLGGP
jgi:hypothetical protein